MLHLPIINPQDIATDALFLPVFIAVSIIVRPLLVRLAIQVEEKVLITAVTYLVLFLVRIIRKRMHKHPQTVGIVGELHHDVLALKEKLRLKSGKKKDDKGDKINVG